MWTIAARLAVSGIAALAASPMLASWTLRAPVRDQPRWWVPGRVTGGRYALLAVLTTALAAASAGQHPWPAWWVYTQVGAVLAIIDVECHRLPNRLIYPLAGAELVTLALAAGVDQQWSRFVHALIAALAVGACWFAWALAAPASLGLGDVRLAALGAALLGWRNWLSVLDGQAAALVLSVATALVLVVARPATRGWRMAVPMGPALIAATVLVALR